MSYYNSKSEARLRTCDPKLQFVFRKVVQRYDNTIIEGHRGEAKQNEAFRTGASEKQWPNGNHNSLPSKAADSAPYPVEFGGPLVINGKLNQKNLNALLRFYHYAGFVQGTASEMGIPIRWGGDWDNDRDLSDQKFNDLVHFELLT